MKNKILKVISIILVIVPIIVYILEKMNNVNQINIIALCILETINILIMLYVFKKNVNNILIGFIICYAIISCLIPVYSSGYQYAPTGQYSDLMGVAYKYIDRDIYGIDITKIITR